MIRIGERIRDRRSELGWTQAELSRNSGVDASLLSRVEKGERRLNETDLWKLSGALGWSPERLFSTSNVETTTSDSMRIPVLTYPDITNWEHVKERLMDGGFTEFIGTNSDYPAGVFGLRICGDSMAPEYLEGDIVIIAPSIAPKPGDFVLAKDSTGEPTFKKYRESGFDGQSRRRIFELVALNPDYGSLRSDLQHLAIIGTMVEHRRFRRKTAQ